MMKDPVRARRAVIAVTPDKPSKIKIQPDTAKDITDEIARFSKIRRIPVSVSESNGIITVSAGNADEYKFNVKFGQIDTLGIGESHLFEVLPPQHLSVRTAVARRKRDTGLSYSCNVEGPHIRVTRHALTLDELGDTPVPRGAPSLYGFERLSTQSEIRITFDRRKETSLRMSALSKAKREGWTIRCRLQDNGTMLVYRTDPGAVVSTQQTDDATLSDSDSAMKAPSSGDGAVKVSAET